MTQPAVKRLNQDLLNSVANEAANSKRLRKNYNFHELSETVQRFINIMQPGSYIRPHRHTYSDNRNGFEFFLVLQGTMGILLFNGNGEIQHQQTLGPQQQDYGIEIPEGTFSPDISIRLQSIFRQTCQLISLNRFNIGAVITFLL